MTTIETTFEVRTRFGLVQIRVGEACFLCTPDYAREIAAQINRIADRADRDAEHDRGL